MSKRERDIRSLIDSLDGLERRVLIDVYRHLKLAHFVGVEGGGARSELDRDYPDQSVFKPMRTSAGKYQAAQGSASEMLQANIERNGDMTDKERQILKSLLARLIEEGMLDPPGTSVVGGASGGSTRNSAGGNGNSLRTRPPEVVTYRRANEESAPEAGAYLIDPADRDEKTRDHMRLQNRFASFLREYGIEPKRIRGVDVDIAWFEDDELVVGEVKTINDANETRQLRLGLGQLLDYLHRLKLDGLPGRGVLLVEREPNDKRWETLLDSHGIRLVWDGDFRRAF